MDFALFIDWAFKALLSGAAIYLINTLSRLVKSVDELNKTVAVEIEKSNWIRISIEKIEKRLDKHEEKFSDCMERHNMKPKGY